MRKTIAILVCMAGLLIMAACGGSSPVNKALAKIDDSIEKIEKNKDKITIEELELLAKEMEEPVSVLKKAIDDGEVGAIDKLKILGKLTQWTTLVASIGMKNAGEELEKSLKENKQFQSNN